jgi:hypothetical protein
MKLPLYQLDAFTRRLFGGNPAAVVLLDAWLPDGVLAAIAAENNLAETATLMQSAPEPPPCVDRVRLSRGRVRTPPVRDGRWGYRPFFRRD